MAASLSNEQFGGESITINKQAMPESTKFDGPTGLKTSSVQNSMAANSNKPLPNPRFNS